MSSSKKLDDFEVFKQDEYDHTFYSCDREHEFVVFTTCYCPLCNTIEKLEDLEEDYEFSSKALDDLENTHYELVGKVSAENPELLI